MKKKTKTTRKQKKSTSPLIRQTTAFTQAIMKAMGVDISVEEIEQVYSKATEAGFPPIEKYAEMSAKEFEYWQTKVFEPWENIKKEKN